MLRRFGHEEGKEGLGSVVAVVAVVMVVVAVVVAMAIILVFVLCAVGKYAVPMVYCFLVTGCASYCGVCMLAQCS